MVGWGHASGSSLDRSRRLRGHGTSPRERLSGSRGVESRSFQITAVCDPHREAAEETAEAFDDLLGTRPVVFSDHEELIASGLVEALDVVTDPSVHHLVAVPALSAGLHVICEKPLGITVRACRAILDAAARSGAVLATAENYRRDGPNRLARRCSTRACSARCT